jgi:hypothetical protein
MLKATSKIVPIATMANTLVPKRIVLPADCTIPIIFSFGLKHAGDCRCGVCGLCGDCVKRVRSEARQRQTATFYRKVVTIKIACSGSLKGLIWINIAFFRKTMLVYCA